MSAGAPSWLEKRFIRPLLSFVGTVLPDRSTWSFEGPSVSVVDDSDNDTTHFIIGASVAPPTGMNSHLMAGNVDNATANDAAGAILDVKHQNETADATLVFQTVPASNAAEYLQVIRNALPYNLTIQLAQLAPVVTIGPGLSMLVRFGQAGVYNAITGA